MENNWTYLWDSRIYKQRYMSCYLFDYVRKSESIFAYSPLNAWSSCGLALWDLYPILSVSLIFVQWVIVIVVSFDDFSLCSESSGLKYSYLHLKIY